jgi:hypothetical protein
MRDDVNLDSSGMECGTLTYFAKKLTDSLSI